MEQSVIFSLFLDRPMHAWDIRYRTHATKRMFERGIDEKDVLSVLRKGEIVERYSDDLPFPSYLVGGMDSTGLRPLHVVVGVNRQDGLLYVITTYEPDQTKWTQGFTRRIPL